MKANVVPDFKEIFEGLPGAYLILSPAFIILAATDSYLRAALRERETIVGKYLFDVFPDNPEDPKADGVANLTKSLQAVLATKKPHAMDIQKYDIQLPEKLGGGWEKRYWRPSNSPILDNRGNVRYIAHLVEDVTRLVDSLGAAMDKQETMRKEKPRESLG